MNEIITEAYRPGSPGGEMKCPYCGENTKDAWKQLIVSSPPWASVRLLTGSANELSLDEMSSKQLTAPKNHSVTLDWMICEADDCKQLVVRVHESWHEYTHNIPFQKTNTWYARPEHPNKKRQTLPMIPPEFERDYSEAETLLDISPRMSGVLSRRMLGDLLERYAKIKNKSLAKQIDLFAADSHHPRRLREGLHHFREVGDFAAHTQTDEVTNEIIDIDRDEAEWTLDRVDELIEYFILDPQREADMRSKMDQKIAAAGRNPIPPLPPDPEVPSE